MQPVSDHMQCKIRLYTTTKLLVHRPLGWEGNYAPTVEPTKPRTTLRSVSTIEIPYETRKMPIVTPTYCGSGNVVASTPARFSCRKHASMSDQTGAVSAWTNRVKRSVPRGEIVSGVPKQTLHSELRTMNMNTGKDPTTEVNRATYTIRIDCPTRPHRQSTWQQPQVQSD